MLPFVPKRRLRTWIRFGGDLQWLTKGAGSIDFSNHGGQGLPYFLSKIKYFSSDFFLPRWCWLFFVLMLSSDKIFEWGRVNLENIFCMFSLRDFATPTLRKDSSLMCMGAIAEWLSWGKRAKMVLNFICYSNIAVSLSVLEQMFQEQF